MRKTELLHESWQFSRGDFAGVSPDSVSWERVTVPHDWAIGGPFDRFNDAQDTRIVNNGEEKKSWHYGRTGALPHVGSGTYRKILSVPASDAGKSFRLEFDGIMSHSRIFVNGKPAGGRPYGYTSFDCDITALIRPGEENELVVTASNLSSSSRWYPGAGIYRDARLVTMDPCHLLYNGIWIRTKDFSESSARISVHAEASEPTEFTCEIFDPAGDSAAKGSGRTGEALELTLAPAIPWSPDFPALYTARIELASGDSSEVKFGLRNVVFDSEKGMTLNGKYFRMNGVCLHHDLGPFGAAFSRAAAKRMLGLLKGIGANAIRMTHNPPAPGLLDLCDEMGFVVIDEAFDCWRMQKIENDYHTMFDEWHEKDLESMIRRDRNHPSVILWSIGNEIIEQSVDNNSALAEELVAFVHGLDPDRRVTAGLSFDPGAITSGIAAALDVPGFNYKPHRYLKYHKELPGKPIYGSETASTVSSRGEYFFPLTEGPRISVSGQCSSYDQNYAPWATTPDKEFHFQDQSPWVMGEFVWTGFDYLGEPHPFDGQWPSRSSYFGIFDLAGLPKDRAWLYRSRWSSEPTLHILPHWNLPNRAGQPTPVHVYTSFDEAELFLNGKSQGRRKKNGEYRLCWDYVLYEPGELKAVAYAPDGSIAMTEVRRTASQPVTLLLELEENRPLRADGEDLAFIHVKAIDETGTVNPDASFRVRFRTAGPLALATVCNGDATSLECFNQDHIDLFHGEAVVSVRATGGGTGIFSALSETGFGLFHEALEIRTV